MEISEYRRNILEISGKQVSYGSFYHNITDNPNGLYLEVPHTGYSDYGGTTGHRANCNYFLKLFGELEGVYELTGGYSSRGVIILYSLYENNEQIKEIIDKLFEYPLINEDYVYEVENEIETEAWDIWIKDDLIRQLERKDKEYPEDEDELRTKFYETADSIGEYIIFEDAVSCYIDISKITNAWK